MRLCSACLLGIACRYDGQSVADKRVLALAAVETLIPVCPEQLGGLPTPRPAAEIRSGRVIDCAGFDVSAAFHRGAEQTLAIARLYAVGGAIFKQRSPSCGCGRIYDGNFSGRVVSGDGITTRLLKENGIPVVSEDDL